MIFELTKSILALLAWPAAVLAIAWLVCATPQLAQRLDGFLFPSHRDGDPR